MEPEVTLETLNQYRLQNDVSWTSVVEELKEKNITIIDIQPYSPQSPGEGQLILRQEGELNPTYYATTSSNLLFQLENHDTLLFDDIDQTLPTEDLIVIQEKETGKTFIAQANADNSLEPLQTFWSTDVKTQDLWISPKITPDNKFIHDFSVANPTQLLTTESNKLTFNTNPVELQKLIHQVHFHNQFISKYGIPNEQSPFKAMAQGMISTVKPEISAKQENTTNPNTTTPAESIRDNHSNSAQNLNDKVIQEQKQKENLTALNKWFSDVERNLPDNIRLQDKSLKDGLWIGEDVNAQFVDKQIVALRDKETGQVIIGELQKSDFDGTQKLVLHPSVDKTNFPNSHEIPGDQLLSSRYAPLTKADSTGTHLKFEHTPVTKAQLDNLSHLARTHSDYLVSERKLSADNFNSKEVETAMDLSRKAESQSILALSNMQSTGKTITDEQKIVILKSKLTDEQKIVALTFLNDKNPKKTIDEGYKAIINRTEKVLDHKRDKLKDKSKGTAKERAAKAAGVIEKISRTTID